MTNRAAVVSLCLVTSSLIAACGDPPVDGGTGGAGGAVSQGTGGGGADGAGGSTDAGGSPNATGGTEAGSGGNGGLGDLPPLGGDCEVSLEREVVIRGRWVEGEAPEALGGPVQPGVYDLTAYQRYTASLPDDIYLGFGALYSGVIEFGSDGTFRAIDSNESAAQGYFGEFSTSGLELSFAYSCPEATPSAPRLYTATTSTLHLHGASEEYVFTRRPD